MPDEIAPSGGSAAELLKSIESASEGLTLAKLLARHPGVARRTAQRWIGQWVEAGRIRAAGQGRGRRYLGAAAQPLAAPLDAFPQGIPVSPDSRDILAYIEQPLQRRTPVGWQREFLEGYEPNRSFYLSEPLRRQLHAMGGTAQAQAPAGTYSRMYGPDALCKLYAVMELACTHVFGSLDGQGVAHARSLDEIRAPRPQQDRGSIAQPSAVTGSRDAGLTGLSSRW